MSLCLGGRGGGGDDGGDSVVDGALCGGRDEGGGRCVLFGSGKNNRCSGVLRRK